MSDRPLKIAGGKKVTNGITGFQLVLHPGKQVAGKEVAVNFHQLETPQKTAIQFPKISATNSLCFPGCSEMAG